MLIPLCGVPALNIPGLDVSAAFTVKGNSAVQTVLDGEGNVVDRISQGGPSPVVTSVAVGLPLEFTPLISLEPELYMFGTHYELYNLSVIEGFENIVDVASASKAVPTEIETANSVWLLSLMIDVPLRFTIRINETLSAGGGIHNVLLLHIPTLGWGNGAFAAGSSGDTYRSLIASYFYKSARFYYPGAGLFFSWKFSDRIGLVIRSRILFPLFHAWDGESAYTTFYDQMIISGRIGLRIYF